MFDHLEGADEIEILSRIDDRDIADTNLPIGTMLPQAHACDLRRRCVRLDTDVPPPFCESNPEAAATAADLEHASRIGRDPLPDRLPAKPGVRRQRRLPGVA
jgi:hypothetical protein